MVAGFVIPAQAGIQSGSGMVAGFVIPAQAGI